MFYQDTKTTKKLFIIKKYKPKIFIIFDLNTHEKVKRNLNLLMLLF